MTLATLLQEFPPCLVRLLARSNGSPLTSRQIASQSGISRDRVDYISSCNNWQFIRIGEALAFMKACGLELTNARRQREFIKRNDWGHLSKGKKQKYYMRLMKRWVELLRYNANSH